MASPLENRLALVTGAAKGIGAATAAKLAEAGAHVLALGRDAGSLKKTEQRIRDAGGTVDIVVCDLAKPEQIRELSETIDHRFGRLDILVGNAALLGARPLLNETDFADWQTVLAVNLTANMLLIRWLDGLLRKSDAARAVFITAGSTQHPFPKGSAYTVTKAGLEALARIYAVETEKTTLCVNLFNPGPVRTTMRAAVAPNEDPMTLDTPDQVAEHIADICMTGVTVTGKLYSYPDKKFMNFGKPTPA